MEQSSMYAKYRAEYDSATVYETKEGFATYKIETLDNGEKAVYIEETYVIPEYRGSHLSAKILDKCAETALEHDPSITWIITSTSMYANNSERAVKNILKHGFEISSKNLEMIYFMKKINKGTING